MTTAFIFFNRACTALARIFCLFILFSHQVEAFGNGCSPTWKEKQEECPYGHLLPGHVTMPDFRSGWTYISVFYGYVPFLVALFLVLRFLLYRGTSDILICIGIGLTSFINETFLKNTIEQHRPGQVDQITVIHKDKMYNVGSCNVSCGMPSGHSATATIMFILIVLDYFCLTVCKKLEPRTFIIYFWIAFIICLPTPISRVILYDHSSEQAMAGTFVGILFSMIWISATHWFHLNWYPKYGEPIFKINDFVLLYHTLPVAPLSTLQQIVAYEKRRPYGTTDSEPREDVNVRDTSLIPTEDVEDPEKME